MVFLHVISIFVKTFGRKWSFSPFFGTWNPFSGFDFKPMHQVWFLDPGLGSAFSSCFDFSSHHSMLWLCPCVLPWKPIVERFCEHNYRWSFFFQTSAVSTQTVSMTRSAKTQIALILNASTATVTTTASQVQNAELMTMSSNVFATLGWWQNKAQVARTKMMKLLSAVSMHQRSAVPTFLIRYQIRD